MQNNNDYMPTNFFFVQILAFIRNLILSFNLSIDIFEKFKPFNIKNI